MKTTGRSPFERFNLPVPTRHHKNNQNTPRRFYTDQVTRPEKAYLFLCLLLPLHLSGQQTALTRALKNTQASAVIIQLTDGRVVAKVGEPKPSTPGSTIKPLLLAWALHHGTIQPDTKIYCRRALQVAQQRLPCTHPADQTIFTAQSAIAESCNTYFATFALRMRDTDLEAALQATHLPHTDATNDSPEQRERTVLGLEGLTATPLQLARAYRALLLNEDPNSAVIRGLRDSVNFGMADPAHVDGMELLGKTGTASDSHQHWTHGWFAGALPGKFVIVIYLPRGNGGDAAALAGAFFRATARHP